MQPLAAASIRGVTPSLDGPGCGAALRMSARLPAFAPSAAAWADVSPAGSGDNGSIRAASSQARADSLPLRAACQRLLRPSGSVAVSMAGSSRARSVSGEAQVFTTSMAACVLVPSILRWAAVSACKAVALQNRAAASKASAAAAGVSFAVAAGERSEARSCSRPGRTASDNAVSLPFTVTLLSAPAATAAAADAGRLASAAAESARFALSGAA